MLFHYVVFLLFMCQSFMYYCQVFFLQSTCVVSKLYSFPLVCQPFFEKYSFHLQSSLYESMSCCIPAVHSLFYDIVDFSVRSYSFGVHKLCVLLYVFLLGCHTMVHSFCVTIVCFLLWCTRFLSTFDILLFGCHTLVHSLCVTSLYFLVRLSYYGALVMCQHFIFSC